MASDFNFDNSELPGEIEQRVPDNPRAELEGQGYSPRGVSACPKCGTRVQVYESPEGRRVAFNTPYDQMFPNSLHEIVCGEKDPEPPTLPPVWDQKGKKPKID